MTDQADHPESSQHEGAVQGHVAPLSSPEQRHAAMDLAFDYRGDIRIQTSEGRVIEGYVFDRGGEGEGMYLRMIPSDQQEKQTVYYREVTELVFSGRDTAAGKSWETWMKKYQEKRARGEAANLEPEPLD